MNSGDLWAAVFLVVAALVIFNERLRYNGLLVIFAGVLAIASLSMLTNQMIGNALGGSPSPEGAAPRPNYDSASSEEPVRKRPQEPWSDRTRSKAQSSAARDRSSACNLPQHLGYQLRRALRDAETEQARFSLSRLHPEVRLAAENARRAERTAIRARFCARRASELAENAAERARDGRPGHWRDGDDRDRWREPYEGEWSGYAADGYGISHVGGGRYSGRWGDGAANGVGVLEIAGNARGADSALRYEGEYARNAPNGFGVHLWIDGRRYAGRERDGWPRGPGVMQFPDGHRYEGEWANGRPRGFGAFWDPRGQVLGAGYWTENDRLPVPLQRR